ncbi:MAG: TrmH family RNA methyltransferase, partial [Actinomycetota bacterium]|nr:TrmH family RNA methyltransferase [Actinomycetota bacterium]
ILDGLEELKSSGFTCIGLTPNIDAEDISMLNLDEDTGVALLVGAEGPGLTKPALRECDYTVRIPMSRDVDSLNVGTAVAVALYAVREARRS